MGTCRHRLLLLLAVVALSGRSSTTSSSSSSFGGGGGALLQLAAAAQSSSIEDVPLTWQTISAGVAIKNTSRSADRAAPAAVALRYRAPGQGRGGIWDNLDYGDDRNIHPTRYCGGGCRVTSARISSCQCVTRASLGAFNRARRQGRRYTPTCCYLGPPLSWGGGWYGTSGGSSGTSGGGTTSGSSSGTSGGGSSSGTSGGGEPTGQQIVQLQTYAVGQCSANGVEVIESNIRGFIAQMPGVVGSSVLVQASIVMLPSSTAGEVVAASAAKVQAARAQSGDISAQANTVTLPPSIDPNVVCQINIEARFEGPASSALLLKNLWTAGGPCNKIFNNICGSYYQVEADKGCISEAGEVPMQFGSCEFLAAHYQPPASPSPPQPPASPSPSPPTPVNPSPSPQPPVPPEASPSPQPPPSPSPLPPSPSPRPPSPSPTPGVFDGDKQALLASVVENPRIKQEMLNGWEPADALCVGPQTEETRWTGITCKDPINKPGVVGKIVLNGGSATVGVFGGPIPNAWGDLLEPTHIEVQYNFLTGTLPASYSKLTTLQVLKLDYNRQTFNDPTATGIAGTIPPSWSGMVNLETLLIAGNNINGTFPPELTALTKLSYLSVAGNTQLGGFLPSSYNARVFNMAYAVDYPLNPGTPTIVGPENYGAGGKTLYTGSGPLWRTNIVNWAGSPNNTLPLTDPNRLPNPDPCVANPNENICK